MTSTLTTYAGIALTGVSGWGTIPVASISDAIWAVSNQPAGDFPALAATPGTRIITGDFLGDGRTGLALFGLPSQATMPTAIANGDGTWTEADNLVGAFPALASHPGAQLVTGDFLGDGRTGIALLGLPNQSALFVAYASSPGRWLVVSLLPGADFLTWAATPGARVVTGDFAGTGRTAFALTGVPSWNTVPVAFPNPDGTCTVTNQPAPGFATWAATPGVQVLAGAFGDSARSGIALTGVADWATMPVAFADGDGTWTITNQFAGAFPEWAATPGARVVPGNFAGNGRTAIALTGVPGWGSIPVAAPVGDGTWTVTNPPAGIFAEWASLPGATAIPI